MRTMKTARLILAVAGVLMAGGLAGAQAPGGPGMGLVVREWGLVVREWGPRIWAASASMERAFGGAGGHGSGGTIRISRSS